MPRTFKRLYPDIYDFDNLWAAWRRARRGGKRKWPTVAGFEFDLEGNLWALHDELRDRVYHPGPYRHFTICTPKVRRISAAPFRDRVVHHALMQVTWPIFEARMIHDSYACRVNKGTHRARGGCAGLNPRTERAKPYGLGICSPGGAWLFEAGGLAPAVGERARGGCAGLNPRTERAKPYGLGICSPGGAWLFEAGG